MSRNAVLAIALILGACSNKPTPATCLGGSMKCDDSCVDPMSDQMNCGACGMACGADSVCTAGACAPVAQLCNGDGMMCGSDCVDPMQDENNCGACGTVCLPDQRCLAGTCTDPVWTVAESHAHNGYAAFANSVAANATEVYALDVTTAGPTALETYTLPTTAAPTGTYTLLTAPPAGDDLTYFDNPSLIGTSLYAAEATTLYAYDTTAATWSTAATLPDTTDRAETATDGTYVYLWASDGYLLQYDPTTATTTHFQSPVGSPLEPRVAWDSATNLLYLASYSGTALWSFNPTTSMFMPLAPSPGTGTSDAFCSDNRGHLFTTNTACSADAVVWMYTASEDAWSSFPALPNDHGCQVSCATSADGWLFLEANDVTVSAAATDVLTQYRLYVPDTGSGGQN